MFLLFIRLKELFRIFYILFVSSSYINVFCSNVYVHLESWKIRKLFITYREILPFLMIIYMILIKCFSFITLTSFVV